MSEVFEAKERLLRELGWSENPFVKDLRTSNRETFFKYYRPFEAATIAQRLAFDAKACMLLGPKGVGKTSALYFVLFSLPENEFLPIFFKEPPSSVEEIASAVGFSRKKGFLNSFLALFGRKRERLITREELISGLRRVGKKIVFFVDEAHLAREKNPEMFMEFKYLLDDVPNLRVIFSALDKEGFPDSLIQLIGEGNIFQRKNFSAREMSEIVACRIKAVGGVGLNPFAPEFLEKVFSERNLLSPRYVFDELNNYLASLALGKSGFEVAEEFKGDKEDSIVQAAIAYSFEEPRFTTIHADWWQLLSPSQKQILGLLLRFPNGLSLSEIRKYTNLSQNTAFNALYQLRGSDEAEKKRKPAVPWPLIQVQSRPVGGRKKNIYFTDAKIKALFTTT